MGKKTCYRLTMTTHCILKMDVAIETSSISFWMQHFEALRVAGHEASLLSRLH